MYSKKFHYYLTTLSYYLNTFRIISDSCKHNKKVEKLFKEIS